MAAPGLYVREGANDRAERCQPTILPVGCPHKIEKMLVWYGEWVQERAGSPSRSANDFVSLLACYHCTKKQ